MAEIRILDKHTAELIAAGEVVERPASVVKELTENAIDAGAHSIEVEIAGGGIRCIEIRDDGCGIEPEYMHNAFVRHATSKIETENDLEAIRTLGFRGEALASVASVARVSLLSKTAAEETAWRYEIDGGIELSLREDAGTNGTTITVRDLFYNTPARMKFLKKDTSEATFVQDAVEHLALSHPEIAFRFIRDGKEVFYTPGDGKLISAVHALFPRDYARELIPVDYSENGMRVSGLITPPRAARASRNMQYFYVNGRYVKSRTMMAAAENAYRGILMGGRFPGCVLMLQLPADAVDVNVHPAKTEVRFSRESDVFNAVYRAVKNAVLTPESTAKQLKIESEKEKTQGVQIAFTTLSQQETEEQTAASLTEDKKGSAEKSSETVRPQPQGKKIFVPSEERTPRVLMVGTYLPTEEKHEKFKRDPYETLDISVDEPSAAVAEPAVPVSRPVTKTAGSFGDTEEKTPSAAENAPNASDVPAVQEPVRGEDLILVGEIFRTYILAQRGEELCIIDKHAAHERLIYEELSRNYGSVAGQLLLLPVTTELSAAEKTALLEQREYLENIGLSVDDFGGRSVIVREVPADIRVESVEELVQEIAARLASGEKEPLSEKTAWVLHSVACRAAIKGGDVSHEPELLALARDILDGTVPPFCPHGRPVVLRMTRKELEKQFGRLG